MPPFVPILAAAIALPLLPLNLRRLVCVGAPLLALGLVVNVADGSAYTREFLGHSITLLRVDPLSRIFAMVFALAATAANLYGWHRTRTAEQVAALLYAGGGMAVVLAGDLLTALVAWEVMAVASAVLVFDRRSARAVAAGQRYLLVHLAAGSLFLLGVVGLLSGGQGIEFGALADLGWPAWAILASLCINAAVPPLQAWLPDAYPESTVSGSVFLSTFTTKAAVYCLARGFAGSEVLVPLGAVMAVYGVVFATLEDNMRRLLSYHIVSQVGYMVCGIGVGSALALNGTVAHAVCHILYKALLFMAVGAVVYRSQRERLSELGGLHRTMPWTLGLYMVGALSISGAPLFNGFVSKSLVVSGAAADHHATAVFLLTLASVGTFLSVGLKLPYFAWADQANENDTGETGEPPPHMLMAMGLLAALCIFIGVRPGALYSWLPWQPVPYDAFTSYHVFEMLLIMATGALAFWQLRRLLTPHRGETLDLDQLYRRPSNWLAVRFSVADGLAARCAQLRDATLRWGRDSTRLPDSSETERPAFDENRSRPPVATPITWILTTITILVALLLLER